MQCCLFYYKSQTQARRASEVLETHYIPTSLTKPPRDYRMNYCTYAVKIPEKYHTNAYNLLCDNHLLPMQCKSMYFGNGGRL